MTTISIKKKNYERKFYQTLMTVAFAINTGHKYDHILRPLVYVYIFDWFVMVFFAPGCVILEGNFTEFTFVLELIQYMLVGLFYVLICILFLIKNNAITSNYNLIQNDFIQWSEKRGVDPNASYKNNLHTVKYTVIFIITIVCSISLGPLFSAINDNGELPLDSRSHFILIWPKIIKIETMKVYGIIYVVQFVCSFFLYASTISLNFGCMVFLSELMNQFRILLNGIQSAFDNHRMENNFQYHFVECIRHHQTIIRFVDDFRSYFKWVILIELVTMQLVFTTLIYNITKLEASLGYKVKNIGSFMFNVTPFIFHCHIGEVILSLDVLKLFYNSILPQNENMSREKLKKLSPLTNTTKTKFSSRKVSDFLYIRHTRLAEHVYEMIWYDMPNKNKQLIVIMFQRTQRDLSLNSAIFSGERASRQLISKVIKQVYTFLNVLLKTS